MADIINSVGGGRLTDSYTCYKGMSVARWRALNLVSKGFEMEAEISVKCMNAGWKITELPISYNPRSFEEGKKIKPIDAVKGILMMFRSRFFLPRPSLSHPSSQ